MLFRVLTLLLVTTATASQNLNECLCFSSTDAAPSTYLSSFNKVGSNAADVTNATCVSAALDACPAGAVEVIYATDPAPDALAVLTFSTCGATVGATGATNCLSLCSNDLFVYLGSAFTICASDLSICWKKRKKSLTRV